MQVESAEESSKKLVFCYQNPDYPDKSGSFRVILTKISEDPHLEIHPETLDLTVH